MRDKLTAISMLLISVILASFSFAAAQEQDAPPVYVIKRGDTLWGLSERFMKDPYYWPNMWSANEQITNPHIVYPGQKIKIYPDRIEMVENEEGGSEKAVTVKAAEIRQDVVQERTFPFRGNEGFIIENGTKPFGRVVGIHHDRVVAGMEDIVYTDIGTNHGGRAGQRFAVFKEEEMVSHPADNIILGRRIIPLGTLQLTDMERTASRAIITSTYKEVEADAILLPYKNVNREVVLKKAAREQKGYIVASNSGTRILSAGDIVYIDLGRKQGVERGNMMYIVRDVKIDRKYTQGRVDKIPQELLGAIVVLETGNNTSTAIIVKSIDTIYKGDKLLSQTR